MARLKAVLVQQTTILVVPTWNDGKDNLLVLATNCAYEGFSLYKGGFDASRMPDACFGCSDHLKLEVVSFKRRERVQREVRDGLICGDSSAHQQTRTCPCELQQSDLEPSQARHVKVQERTVLVIVKVTKTTTARGLEPQKGVLGNLANA